MRLPIATYRLQLNRSLTFDQAAAVVPYLDRLGIGDVYASPVSAARPGSLHGYDVLDHRRVNPELGSDAALRTMAGAIRDRGLGLILDVVPNHMCIAGPGNAWWSDVLENGPGARSARYFDIDWNPPKPDLVDKVLVPILGDQYGRVLEAGELAVTRDGGRLLLRVPGSELPLAPQSWTHVLQPALAELRLRLGPDHPAVLELESIRTAIAHLPARSVTEPDLVRERERETDIVRQRLLALCDGTVEAQAALDHALTILNGQVGDPRSFDALEALLEDQAYRLSFWRVATDEINYRRFFEVNELAAIRVEEPDVFDAVHEIPFAMLAEGLATGLRIDHIDGLLEPDAYLTRLRRELDARGDGFYLAVEKILIGEERLPDRWPVAGTTGYEARLLLDGLFIDPEGARRVEQLYTRLITGSTTFTDLVYQSKKLVLRSSLSSELTVLARRLDRVSEQHRFSRDFTLIGLQHALAEVIACFPVYRSYIARDTDRVDDADRISIEQAVAEARRRNPATSGSLFEFIRSVLLLERPDGLDERQLAERRDFVLRFQQLSAPVMAKGFEDTAFYRWFPLASEADVGGEPDRAVVSLERFHRANAERLARWPASLVTTSTHDSKRGEEVRARIRVLSEVPSQWRQAVTRWRRRNAAPAGSGPIPSANDEYLLYQTLVGTWPVPAADPDPEYRDRIHGYMEKAIREAKVHTSWISPNEPYEQAVHGLIDRVLAPGPRNRFLPDLARFAGRLLPPALWALLSEVLLKITVPGVPDFYQGTEVWGYWLVDPDNRRPVDFAGAQALLDELDGLPAAELDGLIRELARQPADPRLKLLVTTRGLRARRARAEVFAQGPYLALDVEGPRAAHVVAFARGSGETSVLVLAGRWFAGLDAPPVGDVWAETHVVLPAGIGTGRRRDLIAGLEVEPVPRDAGVHLPLARVFERLPLAMLDRV